MVQDTLESRVIFYLLQALLGGLIFLICVWKRLGQRSQETHGLEPVAFLCFSGSALARGLFGMSLLSGGGLQHLSWLFLPLSALETVFLGGLMVRLAPSPTWKRLLTVLLVVTASAHLLIRLAVSRGAPVLYEPPYQGGFLHLPVVLLLLFLARRASPRRWTLFQTGLALLAGSYLAESAVDAHWPAVPLFFWNLQHVAKILALVSFAVRLEMEASELYVGFVLRLGLVVILTVSSFTLLLSETLWKQYLEAAANETQIHLGEFLQGHLIYFHRQGLAPEAILKRDEISRTIVSQFTFIPGLKRVKLEVSDRQLAMEIDPDGVISARTGSGIFTGRGERRYDREDNTVTIQRAPVSYDGKRIGALQFDGDLLFLSRRIAREMLLAFSSLMAAALAMLVGGVLYSGYRQMQGAAALQAQLQQSQKMEAIGRLAGGVAHDFNNLLTVILGYSELLLTQLRQEDSLRPDVEEIKKAGDRATMLTRQLLAFGRKQMLRADVVDLNSVVHNMGAILRRLIGEDIEFVVVTDPALGRVKADVAQIEQVIMNLAVNARDAMPQGGRLTIKTVNVEVSEGHARADVSARPGRYVALRVSDTGSGMDTEVRAHLFEPFFTTKSKGEGTGLGLSMVYGIVKQSGGYIWVDSEPGRGAMFTIYLPAVEEGRVAVEAAEAVTGSASGSETVLLVEDDAPVRALARDLLRQKGYTILEAGGAQEALSLSERYAGPIHLLLTDIVMPGMSGRMLADRLAPSRPSMKVLFMSGYTDDAIVERGVRQASMAFLQKPFAPDVLTRKVRDVLDTAARWPIPS